jgi:hypothetical protein
MPSDTPEARSRWDERVEQWFAKFIDCPKQLQQPWQRQESERQLKEVGPVQPLRIRVVDHEGCARAIHSDRVAVPALGCGMKARGEGSG